MENNIIIRGARQNNLKNVSLEIPKNKITVFTGVSGSGKSSLVFETIGAESQRQFNETYNSFIRHRLQHFNPPEVDQISNLNVSIIINQKRIGGNARSTVGTATDTYSFLRLLFSRIGQPFAGHASVFSFNNPKGMCPRCEGLGKVSTIDESKLIDKNRSLNEGAVNFPGLQPGGWRWMRYVYSGYFDNDKKLKDYTKEEWDLLMYAEEHKPPNAAREWGKTVMFEGIIPRIERSFLKRESKEFLRHQESIQGVIHQGICPECHGDRLNKEILACRINHKNIADCSKMQIDELIEFLQQISNSQVKTVVHELEKRLTHMVDIGLSYLSLARDTSSLSGGESQRIKMVKHLGSSLTGLLYIFDEPSIGLHPADVDRLKKLILQLRDKGNTILVVEHDPDMIALADHVVDMGPEAGVKGGRVMYEGSLEGLQFSDSLTGKYIFHKPVLNEQPREFEQTIRIRDANMHNLKNVSVTVPMGVLTVVTGVAGSGKSSLINQVLPQQFPEAKLIDQGALTGSKRSHLASYSGIFDSIRQLFAKSNKVSASLFSANSEGACPECRGTGVITLDLAFMDEVAEVCDVCNGSGYRQDVLQYQLRGKNIHEVLLLTVAEAVEFFIEPAVKGTLQTLARLGLDYITLGQSLSSFSGGERQRLKLASELDEAGRLFIFDEPTTGLHPSDIRKIMKVFHELVEKGNTVIVIEHNLDVIAQADWIIDMGPGAGSEGGRVIFEGNPEALVNHPDSITGKYLAMNYQH